MRLDSPSSPGDGAVVGPADRLRGAHSTVVAAGTERASSTAVVGHHLQEQQNNPKNLLSRLPTRPPMRNPTTTLTPSQQAAFDQFTQHLDAESEPISSETAVGFITDGRFERPEAQELLEQLLLKGYLYEFTHGLNRQRGASVGWLRRHLFGLGTSMFVAQRICREIYANNASSSSISAASVTGWVGSRGRRTVGGLSDTSGWRC